jgi:hypothetical protein
MVDNNLIPLYGPYLEPLDWLCLCEMRKSMNLCLTNGLFGARYGFPRVRQSTTNITIQLIIDSSSARRTCREIEA